MRWRPLPRDGYSWSGYIWLVYLGTPIWFAASHQTTTLGAWLTFASLPVFLSLYFLGYWVTGRAAFAVITAIAALGMALSPLNAGAAVYFIYAASFAGRAGSPRVGAGVLAGLVAIVIVETLVVGLSPEAWGPTIPLIVLIGGLNVAFAEIGRRQKALRRKAEDESQRAAIIAERERIGRDLHDLLGHTLSVITLKAELATKLATRDPDRALAEMQDVERISRDALAEVRRAVQGYGRSTLTDELQHARDALEAAGATFDADVADVELTVAEEQALAFAIREAVTNVIRHARATRCAVRLRLDANASVLRLEIRDNGRGGADPEGSGLTGMRARVVALGGRVERDGREGTRLTITMPATASRRVAVVAGTA
jgi:two-component system sensor histidine kinase DesK